MKMKTTLERAALALGVVLALGLVGRADDGMWMPHQMKDLNLKAQGLRMNPEDLYRTDGTGLMSAVVNLGGGTGEFVSPEGLILTNHHVAYGAIQRASSKDKDYITDGFLARTRGEEIQAQGYTAGVLLGYEDVTARVNTYFKPKMTPRQRYDAFDKAQKELVAAGEKGGRTSAASWPRCTAATPITFTPSSKSATSASSSRLPRTSATSAARPTTGCGPATPATFLSSGPTSGRTGTPPTTARPTSPTGRRSGSRPLSRDSGTATSPSSWAIPARPTGTPPCPSSRTTWTPWPSGSRISVTSSAFTRRRGRTTRRSRSAMPPRSRGSGTGSRTMRASSKA